jgi:hypothetical protein
VNDIDEELGAQAGGLRSAFYPVFIDVYMAEQALIGRHLRRHPRHVRRADFPAGQPDHGTPTDQQIEIEQVLGPDKPAAANAADPFKRYWRVLRLGAAPVLPDLSCRTQADRNGTREAPRERGGHASRHRAAQALPGFHPRRRREFSPWWGRLTKEEQVAYRQR